MNLDWLASFVDWWTAQRVSAGMAVIAAGAAVTAAASGVRTLRQSRRDSKARSRPMVAAELRADKYVKGTISLIVRNYGPSIARNVQVTFAPEIPDPDSESQKRSMTPFLKARYANPIPVFTPGMQLDNIYYSGIPDDKNDQFVNREPTPDQVTVTITYENDAGDQFTDVYPLDTYLVHTGTYATSSASPEAQMKVIGSAAKVLADIAVKAERRSREKDGQEIVNFEAARGAGTMSSDKEARHRALVSRLLKRGPRT